MFPSAGGEKPIALILELSSANLIIKAASDYFLQSRRAAF